MRYKEFNNNVVLEKCINLFWDNGFTSTSINDIVDVTGVNRFSLYKEFDNKDGILKNSLDLYLERFASKNLAILEENGSAYDLIIKFISSFWIESPEHPPGCYLIFIGTELADFNDVIREYLDNYLNNLESKFEELLKTDKELSSNSVILSKIVTAAFCTSMCSCVIQSNEESMEYLKNILDLNFFGVSNNA